MAKNQSEGEKHSESGAWGDSTSEDGVQTSAGEQWYGDGEMIQYQRDQ